jgi:hypothetical protein
VAILVSSARGQPSQVDIPSCLKSALVGAHKLALSLSGKYVTDGEVSLFVLRARQQMPFAALTGAGLNSDAGRFFWAAHVAAASLEQNASSLHSA